MSTSLSAPNPPACRTRIVRTGEVAVAAPPSLAFTLFTPQGERLWVPGWNPEIHFPADGAAVEGASFTTRGEDGSSTHWVIVDWEPECHRVRYARITPGLRGGTVEVACRSTTGHHTSARVTYDLVAFSDAGDVDLAGWSEPWYSDFLAGWEREIARYLQGN